MKISCDVCENNFYLSLDQREFINESIEKDMNFIMLQCKLCMNSFPINPKNISSSIDVEEKKLRCPVEGCYGLVSAVDDFYGCGECGHVWRDKKLLYLEIMDIIKKYPYRARVYNLNDLDNIKPSEVEPENYEEIVKREFI